MTQENQEGPAELFLAWGVPGNLSKSGSRGGFVSLLVLGVGFVFFFPRDFQLRFGFLHLC